MRHDAHAPERATAGGPLPLSVLCVEDDVLDAELLQRRLLAGGGWRLTLAPDLASARARLERDGPFDLVLLDLQLPDGSGLELLEALRREPDGPAVVVMTSRGDEQRVVAVLKAGADDYVAKADALDERLDVTLRAAVARRRVSAARRARGIHVLYADHQAIDLDLTRRHFAQAAPGLHLDTVFDGRALLARLPQTAADAPTCDVVLLDYRLTGDSGLDVLKVIRGERGLDVPVVMVTGQGSEDVAAMAMRLGATDYVVKTENYLHALPAVLENALHRVVAEREHRALRASELEVRALAAQLEARVVERTRELEAANRELEAFASSVSHDLRAPLRSIDALGALLQLQHGEQLDAEGLQKVALLRSTVERMSQLVTDILELSRLARVPLVREPLAMAPLARHVLETFRSELLARAVDVEIGELPPADGDRTLVAQAFTKLFDNALKFTRGVAAPRVAVRAFRTAEGETAYEVADNGCGFDPQRASGLFTPFRRVHANKAGEGTGVGLAIVERVARRHGGRAWAEGTPDAGARLCFTLAPAPAPAPASAQAAPAAPHGSGNHTSTGSSANG